VIRDLSADAINDREENFADAIRARTSGRGVDVILDIMGGSYFGLNMDALANGGRLVIIGFLGGAMAERKR
jgi:NADPH:quinone reductase